MPTSDDMQFKDLILTNNLVNQMQLDECMQTLSNYEQAGITKPLSSIILEKGYMTLKQINAILQLQGKKDQYIIRGYTIIENVGQGGLGTVFKARQDSVGRYVALKIMFPNLAENPQFLQRFMREAKVCASLEHPHIVKGIDFGESDGIYFFAMEFIDGYSLKDVIQARGVMAEKDAIEIILRIAEVLKYAEEKNLVHRDIKPENILITKTGVPKLCDLGLAKSLETDMSLTHTGIVVGTPHYISPEQGMGLKDLDIRSDIYSLGVTLYYMVTGHLPYKGDSAVNIIGQHITSQVPSPREINKNLSVEIEHIISTMMAKKRPDRYQTAQELIVDLNLFLRGEKPIAGTGKKVTTPRETARREAENPTEVQTHTLLHDNSVSKTDPTLTSHLMAAAVTIDIDKESVTKEVDRNGIKEETNRLPSFPVAQSVQSPPEPDSRKFVDDLEKKVGEKKQNRPMKKIVFLIILCLVGYGAYQVRLLWFQLMAGDSKVSQYIKKMMKKEKPITVEQKEQKIPYQSGAALESAQKEYAELAAKYPVEKIAQEEMIRNMIKMPATTWKGKAVASFYIDRYEVSQGEYEEFCEKTKHPEPSNWPQKINRTEKFRQFPVTEITYYEAMLYARWRGKRLPKEIEWEYAKSEKINRRSNLWEWTNDYFGEGKADMVIRRNWDYGKDGFYSNGRKKDIGFRCVLDISQDNR